jgi:hypothetical protein
MPSASPDNPVGDVRGGDVMPDVHPVMVDVRAGRNRLKLSAVPTRGSPLPAAPVRGRVVRGSDVNDAQVKPFGAQRRRTVDDLPVVAIRPQLVSELADHIRAAARGWDRTSALALRSRRRYGPHSG